jgi:hypothetical protein
MAETGEAPQALAGVGEAATEMETGEVAKEEALMASSSHLR